EGTYQDKGVAEDEVLRFLGFADLTALLTTTTTTTKTPTPIPSHPQPSLLRLLLPTQHTKGSKSGTMFCKGRNVARKNQWRHSGHYHYHHHHTTTHHAYYRSTSWDCKSLISTGLRFRDTSKPTSAMVYYHPRIEEDPARDSR
ncbi:hypothetical protein V1478_016263, partial [Vespula squamosa]